jgi:hypothetical protein
MHGSPSPSPRRRLSAPAGLLAATALLTAAVVLPAGGAAPTPSQTAAKAAKLAKAASARSNSVLHDIATAKAGPTGPAGPAGDPGAQGFSGNGGVVGADGSPGLGGAAGNKGATGDAGTPGADGADGGHIVTRARGTSDQDTCSNCFAGNYPLTQNPSWTQRPGEVDVLIVRVAWTDPGSPGTCTPPGGPPPPPGINVNVAVNGDNQGFNFVDTTQGSSATLAPIYLPSPALATDRSVNVSFSDNCDNTDHFTINSASVDVGALLP